MHESLWSITGAETTTPPAGRGTEFTDVAIFLYSQCCGLGTPSAGCFDDAAAGVMAAQYLFPTPV
jgi:hypothetical protein